MSLLVDIASLLPAETVIYYGDLPDTPDSLISLSLTGGFDPTHTLAVRKPSNENPTIQIRLRDASYASGLTRAEAIKDILDGKTSTTINSNNYISIFMIGDINQLSRDSWNRANFTLNFQIKVKRG